MWIVYLYDPDFFHEAISEARSLGLKIAIFHLGINPGSTSDADYYNTFPNLDINILLEELSSSLFNCGIVQVISFKDNLVSLAAEANRRLRVRHPACSPEQAKVAKDKFLLRTLMKDTGISLNFSLIQIGCTPSTADLPLSRSGKWVVKPLLGFGSIGVELVSSLSELSGILSRSATVLSTLNRLTVEAGEEQVFRAENFLLIEEFIQGTEYSAEVFFHNAKPVFIEFCEKSEMIAPYFEEISYLAPGRVPSCDRNNLLEAVDIVSHTLAPWGGVAHMEFIVSEERVCLLDVGLRFGGSGLSHEITKLSAGVNLMRAMLLQAMGRDPNTCLERIRSDLALLYLMQVKNGGKIQEVPIADDCEFILPELTKLIIMKDVGQKVSGYPNYTGLPGAALFSIPNLHHSSYARAEELIVHCSQNLNPKYQVESDPL